MAMNKSELVKQVSAESGLSKVDAGKAVDSVIAVITSSLTAGTDVSVSGLGKFTSKRSAERQGRNPQTGATITIKARNSAKFSAAQALKDAIN
jgi:DNA-binding protein HU-beta